MKNKESTFKACTIQLITIILYLLRIRSIWVPIVGVVLGMCIFWMLRHLAGKTSFFFNSIKQSKKNIFKCVSNSRLHEVQNFNPYEKKKQQHGGGGFKNIGIKQCRGIAVSNQRSRLLVVVVITWSR